MINYCFTEWVLKSTTPPVAMTTSCHSGVFLGGSCGNSQWRNDIAIPLLRFVFQHCM